MKTFKEFRNTVGWTIIGIVVFLAALAIFGGRRAESAEAGIGQATPARMIEGAWWAPNDVAAQRLAFNWGTGAPADPADATEALCKDLGLNARMWISPDIARVQPIPLPYGVEMGSDGVIDEFCRFLLQRGIEDSQFLFVHAYEEKGNGPEYPQFVSIVRRWAPWAAICDGPLSWNGSNAVSMRQADWVLSQFNVSRGFGEDVVWYAALHRYWLPGKRFGISPQMVVGADNRPGDAAEIALAIQCLAPRTDLLPLWGIHHAAKAGVSEDWKDTVRAAMRAWEDYRVGDAPARQAFAISATTNADYWQRAKCRIVYAAGYEPVMGAADDARLKLLLPITGKTTDAGQVHWDLLQKFNQGQVDRATVRAAESVLGERLRAMP
jgi:hypothetical protein